MFFPVCHWSSQGNVAGKGGLSIFPYSFLLYGGGGFYTSPNGINWQPFSGFGISSTLGGGLYDSSINSYITLYGYHSSDKFRTWTGSSPVYTILSAIATDGAGTYVMCGDIGPALPFAVTQDFNTYNYPSLDPGGAGYVMVAIAYGNGMFVSYGHHGETLFVILSSTDAGVSWSSTLHSYPYPTVNSVAFGLGLFVSCGSDGYANYSSDASMPTRVYIGNYVWRSLIFSTTFNIFVAVSLSGDIATSTNGTSWSVVFTNARTDIYPAYIGDNGSVIVVMPSDGHNAIISTDGITWADYATNGLYTPYQGAYWYVGMFTIPINS